MDEINKILEIAKENQQMADIAPLVNEIKKALDEKDKSITEIQKQIEKVSADYDTLSDWTAEALGRQPVDAVEGDEKPEEKTVDEVSAEVSAALADELEGETK